MAKNKNKNKDEPMLVNFVVPIFKRDLEEFREYCKTIDADPRTIVYAFIRAVNEGALDVTPPSNAPFTQ